MGGEHKQFEVENVKLENHEDAVRQVLLKVQEKQDDETILDVTL